MHDTVPTAWGAGAPVSASSLTNRVTASPAFSIAAGSRTRTCPV